MIVPPRLPSKFDVRSGAVMSTKGLRPLRHAVAHARREAAAQAADAGLRDDFDLVVFCRVILRRERVAHDVDRLDEGLGRQRAADEAVDLDHGVAAGHVLQLLRQLIRIVRKGVDFFRA